MQTHMQQRTSLKQPRPSLARRRPGMGQRGATVVTATRCSSACNAGRTRHRYGSCNKSMRDVIVHAMHVLV